MCLTIGVEELLSRSWVERHCRANGKSVFQTTPPSGKRVQNWPERTSLEFSSL